MEMGKDGEGWERKGRGEKWRNDMKAKYLLPGCSQPFVG
jgi:hypothetical protein